MENKGSVKRFRSHKVKTDEEILIFRNLLYSTEFCKQFIPILEPNYRHLFQDAHIILLTSWIIEHFEKYQNHIGPYFMEVFRDKIRKSKIKNVDTINLLEEFLHKFNKTTLNNFTEEDVRVNYGIDSAMYYLRLRQARVISEDIRFLYEEGKPEEAIKQLEEYELITPPVDRYETFTGEEMMDMQIKKPKWLAKGVIPLGCSVLAGAPKSMKSFFVLNLALSVVTGRKAFRSVSVRQSPVIYLALEDNKARMQTRMQAILNKEKPLGLTDLHIYYEFPTVKDGGLGVLEQRVEEWKPRLVVVDILERFRSRTTSRDYSYRDDYGALAGLQGLASKHQLTVVAIHHTNKHRDPNDVFNDINASQGLFASMDTALVIPGTIEEQEIITELHIKGRDIEDKIFSMRFNFPHWILQGEAAEVSYEREAPTIEKIINSANKPMTIKQITELTETKKVSTVRSQVSQLLKNGRISKVSPGLYAPRGYIYKQISEEYSERMQQKRRKLIPIQRAKEEAVYNEV